MAYARDPSALTLGVPTDGTAPAVRALLDEIDPERALVRVFAVRATTLDDVFLALTSPETNPGMRRDLRGVGRAQRGCLPPPDPLITRTIGPPVRAPGAPGLTVLPSCGGVR
jgi:hypothetical protein